MTFASRLRAARLAAGLTQSAAARVLGTCQSVIARYEAGEVEPPSSAARPRTQEEILAALAAAAETPTQKPTQKRKRIS